MRNRWILPLLLLSACGDQSSSPPNGNQPICEDQGYAHLNLLVGRLSDQLYELDVSQVLLVKGATERFLYTVAEHDSSYYRQEIYDLMASSIRIDAAADSIRSLSGAVASAVDTLFDDPDWKAAFDDWGASVVEGVDLGCARFAALVARGASRSSEILLDSTSPEALALSCLAKEIAPRFETVNEFLDNADRGEWREYLPGLPACVLSDWRNGWAVFTHDQVGTMDGAGNPLWGPIGLFHLNDILGSEPGWERAASWGEDPGTLRMTYEDSTSGGTGLAVLLPTGNGLSGSYYHPFLVRSPPRIEPVPRGTYRILLFLSGYRPSLFEDVLVAPGETALLRAEPEALGGEDCVLAGGEVGLWVVDPSTDEHINNDFHIPCDTEVWEGGALFQIRIELDSLGRSCLVRSVTPLRFEVDCVERTIAGFDSGNVLLLPEDSGDYALVGVEPDTFRVRITGRRLQTGLEISIRRDEGEYSAVVIPPGGATKRLDVSDRVFPDYSTRLQLGSAQSAEILSPPGANETSPLFLHITLDRIF